MKSQSEIFNSYAEQLKSLAGISYKLQKDADKDAWLFEGKASHSLPVELYHWKRGADFIGLNIEGVDCAYWHTAELDNLDHHMKLAEAALLGDVAYNRTSLWRAKEVCFKLGDSWECTKSSHNGPFII